MCRWCAHVQMLQGVAEGSDCGLFNFSGKCLTFIRLHSFTFQDQINRVRYSIIIRIHNNLYFLLKCMMWVLCWCIYNTDILTLFLLSLKHTNLWNNKMCFVSFCSCVKWCELCSCSDTFFKVFINVITSAWLMWLVFSSVFSPFSWPASAGTGPPAHSD